jgi:hypothetical protein
VIVIPPAGAVAGMERRLLGALFVPELPPDAGVAEAGALPLPLPLPLPLLLLPLLVVTGVFAVVCADMVEEEGENGLVVEAGACRRWWSRKMCHLRPGLVHSENLVDFVSPALYILGLVYSIDSALVNVNNPTGAWGIHQEKLVQDRPND